MAVASLNDVTADTKKDEIAAYANQVAEEVKAERAGEEKPGKDDAQITSEHAGKPAYDKTPAETKSGSEAAPEGDDTAEADDQGEEAGSESEGREWLTDEVKAEAAAYGIKEAELADFASREEVERALRLFDKSALDAGRKALADGKTADDDGQTRNEKGQFTKKEEPKTDPPKQEGRYEVTLDKDVYDDGLVEELTRMRDHYESRLESLESRFVVADTISRERHFDSLVDSLGHADLFGKTDKETPQEKQRRQDLFVEVETYLRGREVLGRPAELNETVVNRIARSLFADELGKKELKQRTRKISKQSNGRQGGGTTRPQDPREDPRDEFDRLYRELDRAK